MLPWTFLECSLYFFHNYCLVNVKQLKIGSLPTHIERHLNHAKKLHVYLKFFVESVVYIFYILSYKRSVLW